MAKKVLAKKGQLPLKRQSKGKPNRGKSAEPAPVSLNYVLAPHQLEHQKREIEKQKRQEDFKHKKEEKAKKFNEFRKRKMERNKILGQKTQRGQPVMKGRMEMLLNKIQYQMSKE